MILGRVGQALLLGGLAVYAAMGVTWDALGRIEIRWPLVFLAAAIHAGYLAIYAGLWQIITRSLDVTVPFRKALHIWGLSLLGKYLPLKIGAPLLRVAGYRRLAQRPAGAVWICCYLEAVLSLYAAAVVGTLLVLCTGTEGPFPRFRPACAVLLAVLAPFVWPPFLERAMRQVFRILQRPAPTLRLPPKVLLGLLGGYGMAWLVLGTSLFFVVNALTPVSPGYWDDACVAYALAGSAGMIAVFSPSGLGVRDGALWGLMTVGLGAPMALTVSVAARAISVLVETAAAAAIWIGDPSLRDLFSRPPNLEDAGPCP